MDSFISYLKNPFYCESRKLSAIRFIALYLVHDKKNKCLITSKINS